ncbi:type II toxin-antitoxin system Phd/YefM family antitoxin [Desulfitobacterium chlororespirans]|uniref:Antitoxin Phd_YefM, type II toxin-antitoxin system n=1 Tax=Desulfitobacterium chlororespirans DSM 11544 TaxID=1121395 RepID=A0A1M7UK30_9FIRM|nr:type II toxin-antitoxin system Phd/YefM family antitoxin [Desulfitobacterium chlororespirans]SHN83280.1 Antitoxin Phd_YefM, type II toxin-antitoxin system [Desulfitobacterium chlororespirans DSM 11544]
MPIIRPMADLRDTGKISELCCQKDEPVFITKNGIAHLVVMSIDTYEKQMGLLEIYRKLSAAEKQLEEGVPLLTGSEVFGKLRENVLPY